MAHCGSAARKDGNLPLINLPYAGQFLDEEDSKEGRFTTDDSPLDGYDDVPVVVDDILDSDPSKEAELLEEILTCCKTELEREIVMYRVEGYKDPEIAQNIRNFRRNRFTRRKQIGEQYAAEATACRLKRYADRKRGRFEPPPESKAPAV